MSDYNHIIECCDEFRKAVILDRYGEDFVPPDFLESCPKKPTPRRRHLDDLRASLLMALAVENMIVHPYAKSLRADPHRWVAILYEYQVDNTTKRCTYTYLGIPYKFDGLFKSFVTIRPTMHVDEAREKADFREAIKTFQKKDFPCVIIRPADQHIATDVRAAFGGVKKVDWTKFGLGLNQLAKG
jgi:hypothetical protein